MKNLKNLLRINKEQNWEASQFLLIKKNRGWVNSVGLICVLVLFLTGCNPDPPNMTYEIEHLSGNVINSRTEFNKPVPIENSELQIYTKHIKEKEYTLYIQDMEETVLYEGSHAGAISRGQIESEKLWICEEFWSSIQTKQFLDNTLKSGELYQLDLETGEIIWKESLDQNEFFITVYEGKCYFYKRGEMEKNAFMGLVNTPERKAEIYYRDVLDWKEKHTVYTFDYTEVPLEVEAEDLGGGWHVFYFNIEEANIKVGLKKYESNGNGEWGYGSLWFVEIPFLES